MYIIEQLKHNRVQEVDIPSASVLYKQYGLKAGITSQYSGDVLLRSDSSKLDMAKEVMAEANKPETEE